MTLISRNFIVTWIVFLPACLFAANDESQQTRRASQSPASRRFELDYAASIGGVPSGATVRVWYPVPPQNRHQRVTAIAASPAADVQREPRFGNRIAYFSAKGNVKLAAKYRIVRKEVRALSETGRTEKLQESARQRFLAATTKIPLTGRPQELLMGVKFPKDPVRAARQLYDRVDAHVKYDKTKPGYGNGDVNWVCDSRTGNCTDFHSLFISWTRARKIPARFEIGFPLPIERGAGKIGGYHCWASFHTNERGWIPVDISEADKHPEMKEYYFGNLTENRVTFSVGRDIDLIPRQSGAPLNYFVYPYVEVDGKPLDRKHIELQFSFRDLATDQN